MYEPAEIVRIDLMQRCPPRWKEERKNGMGFGLEDAVDTNGNSDRLPGFRTFGSYSYRGFDQLWEEERVPSAPGVKLRPMDLHLVLGRL